MIPFSLSYSGRMAIALLLMLQATVTTASRNDGLAARMLESTIARGQGIYNTAAPTSLIELGIFQQALLETIRDAANSTQRTEWEAYLVRSTTSAISPLSNATADASLPLDRLSIGTALIHEYKSSQISDLIPAIHALTESVLLQQRNANGGLWYYANPTNISYYHNLSYLDGMFSSAPFAVIAAATTNVTTLHDAVGDANPFGRAAALEQLQLLYGICKQPSGLLVHGYDASITHNWSDPITGASPIVWGRSLAWYTLGVGNTLELLRSRRARLENTAGSDCSEARIGSIFTNITSAQIAVSEDGLQNTGQYGVWQVVDHPGESGNFIEASASCMTVYSLLRAIRLHLIEDPAMRSRAKTAALGIYRTVLGTFVTEAINGTLSLSGTSSVASLAGESIDYDYYVSRPTANDSLIGTSAFILASLEVERLA
ncbi:hypothetical protein LTR85_002400 [Meristemomyces frigidus]|nr:hypothetical protein LTR85_002400 [Meristemomyces frigidus]